MDCCFRPGMLLVVQPNIQWSFHRPAWELNIYVACTMPHVACHAMTDLKFRSCTALSSLSLWLKHRNLSLSRSRVCLRPSLRWCCTHDIDDLLPHAPLQLCSYWGLSVHNNTFSALNSKPFNTTSGCVPENSGIWNWYHIYRNIVIRLSVCPLRKVGRSDLTLRHKRLYLWPSSIGSYNKAISVNASFGTSYRHEH